jgi:hypothetical protein
MRFLRQTAEDNLKKVEEKYGPIEQQFKAGKTQTERAQRVREIVEEQRAIWGEDFTKDELLGEQSLINKAWKEEVAAATAITAPVTSSPEAAPAFSTAVATAVAASAKRAPSRNPMRGGLRANP